MKKFVAVSVLVVALFLPQILHASDVLSDMFSPSKFWHPLNIYNPTNPVSPLYDDDDEPLRDEAPEYEYQGINECSGCEKCIEEHEEVEHE